MSKKNCKLHQRLVSNSLTTCPSCRKQNLLLRIPEFDTELGCKAWIIQCGCRRTMPGTKSKVKKDYLSSIANATPKQRDEGAYAQGDCSLIPTPTMEHTIDTITDYTRWWQDKPQPYRGAALGQLNHTKRRLQMILKANH